MKSEDLEIITLTKALLKEAVDNNTYWGYQSKNIPFSKSKAKWLLENDRIENDDVCAILGYEKQDIVAFIYMIPDLINTPQGIKKVFWSRRWWIADKYKDTILSTYTRSLSFKAIKNQAIIKYIGQETIPYYEKQPFTKFSKRNKHIIVFSLDSELLLNNIRKLRTVKPLVKLISSLSYNFTAIINKFKNKKRVKGLTYEYISFIDNHSWKYIEPFLKNDLVVKTPVYINWQIDNSQYTQVKNKYKSSHYCLINSSTSNIYNLNFLVKKETIIGFISILVRNTEFHIRYFITSEDNYDYCVDALMDNFILAKATIIHTENDKLGRSLNRRYFSTHTKKREIFTLVHKDVNLETKNIHITDQDGNFA
ncbi:hypothetical protein [uncultured Algibacter sp.]|uniref:hypothetical protein n=1 Tax=uncultured Algibacter sp. TaxID=298659 RepID=UPI002637484A|nr:hypothetical protein [uncultured Algibacter sp.]